MKRPINDNNEGNKKKFLIVVVMIGVVVVLAIAIGLRLEKKSAVVDPSDKGGDDSKVIPDTSNIDKKVATYMIE